MTPSAISPLLRRRPSHLAAHACPVLLLGLLGAATVLAGCGGESKGAATAAAHPATTTTAVAPPPLPITIESPSGQATIRASSSGSSAVVARIRIAGTAEPGGRLLISGHCGGRRCVRHMTVSGDGAWSSRLRMILPRGTRRKTVRVSYLGLKSAPDPAQVRLRIRDPRPAVARPRSIPAGTSVESEGESAPSDTSPPPGTQTYTVPAPQSGSLAGSGTLVVVGDSLAEGMTSLLPHAFPGWSIRVNARIGRGLAEGMGVLGQTRVPDGSTLAISLFTNDDPWRTPALADAVRETLSRVGPSGCAIWATIAAPPVNGLSYAKANALLRRLAATEPRLRVVPWAEQMAANPGLLGGDGVHPTSAGYELRARMYAQAASSCS